MAEEFGVTTELMGPLDNGPELNSLGSIKLVC
jgi:hypothetical protein